MIEKNKESQNQSLNELQQELKSLKALLLNRPATSSTPVSSLPLLGRPSIPAWQLGSRTPQENSVNSSSIPSAPSPVPPNTSIVDDKGKEVEREEKLPYYFNES
jgi:peroxin-14